MNLEEDIKGPQSNRRALVTYSVLTGLTPLIPVPVVDDLAKNYFRRRLVRALSESRGRSLGPATLDALADEPETGCLSGCLAQVVLYPLKKIFRKVFYFLEWKRAVDLTSRTYHYGYLIDYALSEGLIEEPGGASAEELRAAALDACRAAPIKPVEGAVSAAFRQSKAALVSAAGLLEQSFRRLSRRPDKESVAGAAAAVEEREEQEVAGLVERLQERIGKIPEDHFRRLRADFRARLRPPPKVLVEGRNE